MTKPPRPPRPARGISTIEDLRARSKRDPGGTCWLWGGALSAGRPAIWALDVDRVEMRSLSGPRAVWYIAHGTKLYDRIAYMRCWNTLCVCPAHVTWAATRGELNAASEVDPLALAPYFWRGAFYYFEGKNDLALRELQEAQNIDPNFTLGLALKGAVYREKGEIKEYLDHWLSASPLEGVDLSESDIKQLRATYESKGLKSYEVAYAELLQQRSNEKYVSPLFVAMHYSIADEKEIAIQWLEKAFAERSSWLVELKVDPAWKNLHSDPRYTDLLKRIGFQQ